MSIENEQSNNDLVWDMDEFQHRQLATDFVKRFENKLCVYSGSVEQLYSNYNIYFPEEEGRKMVILPNPYAYHDTFQGVPEDAIQMTGLTIVPGELIGKQGLHLTIPLKSSDGGKKKYRVVPLQAGLRAINQRRPADKPFLPILMKGDLREIENKVPALHLHSIRLDKLGGRSALERKDILHTIAEKLPNIQ
ncbi:hypothetical protein [Oceanicoccus sp. KOV_DT_Chl]|uniref:hypothetical protein n=1 Tax=Oceanicoccus sp. KOV_DT_Chl TaxID=1904639 RepID=UPI000C7BEF81|nr:hypothetical protein [Oceanicoccus sp. KOV_DT_Chl]